MNNTNFEDETTTSYERTAGVPKKGFAGRMLIIPIAAIVAAIACAIIDQSLRSAVPASKPNASTKQQVATTVAPAPKANAIAAPTQPTKAAPSASGKVHVTAVPVATLDWSTCAKVRVVKLQNGGVRVIGEQCAPIQVVVPSGNGGVR